MCHPGWQIFNIGGCESATLTILAFQRLTKELRDLNWNFIKFQLDSPRSDSLNKSLHQIYSNYSRTGFKFISVVNDILKLKTLFILGSGVVPQSLTTNIIVLVITKCKRFSSGFVYTLLHHVFHLLLNAQSRRFCY